MKIVFVGRCLSSLGVWIGFPSANVLLSEVGSVFLVHIKHCTDNHNSCFGECRKQ